ncbi:MAG: HAMP domain-containing sensor histidine kinase [Burkholderiaceae bacterium]
MRRSLSFRLVVAGLIWMGLTLGLTWAGLGRLFDHHVTATYQRQLADRLNLLAASFEWNDRDELVLLQPPADPRYQQPYSGKYWQIDGARGEPLDHSRSLWDQRLALPAPPTTQEGLRYLTAAGPQHQQLLVVDRSVSLPGHDRPVRIAVAMDRAELAGARRDFDHLLALALIALAVGLTLLIAVQVAVGLRPLRRLRESLTQLRRGSARTLAGDWPVEIAPLVEELNALLARDAATIERSRRQAADLAHGLKTPLAILTNVASQPVSEATAGQVIAQTEAMRRQIERHLVRARAVGRARLGGPQTDAGAVVREVIAAMRTLHRDRRLAIDAEGQGRFDGDRQDLIEMCGNLLENACTWAAHRVRVAIASDARALSVTIEDDGPGIDEARIAAIREGNAPLDQRSPGSGLGLSLCIEIAQLYGGRLDLDRSPLGGLRAALVLPVVTAED